MGNEYRSELKAMAGTFAKNAKANERKAKEAKALARKERLGGKLSMKDQNKLREARRWAHEEA